VDYRSLGNTSWSLTNTQSYAEVCFTTWMVYSLVIACISSTLIVRGRKWMKISMTDNSKVICRLPAVCHREMSNTNTPMNDERLIPCVNIRVVFSKSAAPLRGRTVDLSVPLCDCSYVELSWRVTAECSTYWANRADQVVHLFVHWYRYLASLRSYLCWFCNKHRPTYPNHDSHITYHDSHIIHHISYIIYHTSHTTYRVSHITHHDSTPWQ
jgi:hypothetical protein